MEAAGQHGATGTQEAPAQAKSPQDIALGLGPFNPPPDFRFGPEFDSSPPRAIPGQLKQGSHARRWRQRAFTSLAAAAACFIFSWNRFTEELSYYILALGYLDWAGWAIIVALVVTALHRLLTGGRFAYVKKGAPVVARVLESGVYSQGAGEFQTFGFATLVEYRHPHTGEWKYQWIRTRKVDSARKAHRYSTSVRVGDYVTVVGLPGSFEESLAIYGYLGLDPDQDFIRKDGRTVEAPPTVLVLGLMFLVTGVMGLAVLALYVIEFLIPTGGSMAPAAIGAGAVAVAGGGVGLFLRRRSGHRSRNCWVGAILGALAGFLGACCLNAGLDRSPPSYRDIKVVEFLQETWYPLFVRRYEIEYAEKGEGDHKKFSARLETMARFSLGLGVIEVGKGGLGMEWIRGIHPVALKPLEPGHPEEKSAITLDLKGLDGETMTLLLKPVIDLGQGQALEPSAWLTERALEVAKSFKDASKT